MDKREDPTAYDLEFNMTIESFLIHYRILEDFLYPTKKIWESKDDCIAHDFNPNWTSSTLYWDDSRKDVRRRINKKLAHLSYSRSTTPGAWGSPEMLEHIKASMRWFITKLPPEKRAWFDEWAR